MTKNPIAALGPISDATKALAEEKRGLSLRATKQESLIRRITIEDSRGYSTEARLMTSLQRWHLDQYCDYIVCRKPDGNWTAVFLVNRMNGGYIAAASSHGFMSV